MKNKIIILCVCFLLAACASTTSVSGSIPGATSAPMLATATTSISSIILASITPTEMVAQVTPTPVPGPAAVLPQFEHIAMIVLENRSYDEMIGNAAMPFFNKLASQNVLLTNYFAITHPSLPNYIAMISSNTQGITKDCKDCFLNQPNLADLIEASGRSWKTYQEDMPEPCYVGDKKPYFQKHNPFMYFDSIRLDPARCLKSVLPLSSLQPDLASQQMPDFAFIMPNICNSSHDCSLETSDAWLKTMVTQLQASYAFGKNSLIIVTVDEADDKQTESCCGMGKQAGGRVATLLISPLANAPMQDSTAYSQYGLLKTILQAWNLPDLGNTAKPETSPILAPWSK